MEETFVVLGVDERPWEGMIALLCEGDAGVILIDVEAYMRSKAALAKADGVPLADVRLEGRTLALNADGVPLPLPER